MKRLAAVGAFVIGGILLFAIGIFLIGSRRMMFGDTFHVYAEFAEVAALEKGAKVRVAGMDGGEIEEIRVPPGPSAKFRVRMRVRSDLHPIIRLDSVATIQNDGLVGNKYVQIEAGTERSPIVPDQGTIRSREPFDFTDLLQKMSDTIDTVNTTIVFAEGRSGRRAWIDHRDGSNRAGAHRRRRRRCPGDPGLQSEKSARTCRPSSPA